MEDDWIHGAFWTTDDDKIWRVSEDGTQLKGDYTKTLAGKMRQTVRWELNSFPE